MQTTSTSRFFKDSHGKVVLWQKPNVPIILAAMCWLLLRFVSQPLPMLVFGIGFYASLGYWSSLEIAFGVSGFRKFLGLVALAWILWSLFV